MFGLYKPKVLLLNSQGEDYLEKALRDNSVTLFVSKNLDEAEYHLAQENIDIVIAKMDKTDQKIPNLFKQLSNNVSIIIVDEEGGTIPMEWKLGHVLLRKKTAQENILRICLDIQEKKKERKAA